MSDSEPYSRIREELKHSVRRLLEQLRRDHGHEKLYAVMFDVDISETYAICIAASEESLSRLAEDYRHRGYRVQSGDLVETLRAAIRWDAPGDSWIGWYWGTQDGDSILNELLGQAVEDGLIREYDESRPVTRLCQEALQELDVEGVFGVGVQREQLLIGTSCVEVGFCESEEDIVQLSTLNPQESISRLRRELAAADVANALLVVPRRDGERL